MRQQARKVAVPGLKKSCTFAEWNKKFLAYLHAGKECNTPLLALIDVLGIDGRQELELSVFNFLRPDLWTELRKNRRQTGQQVDKSLTNVIRNLNKLAKNYRRLGDIAPEIGPGIVLGAAAPQGFAPFLEAEAMRLIGQQKLAKIAFNHKQGGNKADLAILIRLQDFVDEFARRSATSLPPKAARHLNAPDLADLLEAGKAALGFAENDTITYADAIERALRRFRKHPRNRRICALLKEDAVKACDKLFSGSPASSSQR